MTDKFPWDADVAKEIAQWEGVEEKLLQIKSTALATFTEHQSRQAEISGWIPTEDSVRVHTTRYSIITLAVAFSIIGGSLVVPFLVGERVPGVDPFQFATFGWLLAGAFLVGAKSRYVENWPWHDFLRRQIVCHSVKELAVASHVSEQAVLLSLLHTEFRSPLRFRGPFPGPFQRRSEPGQGGFSIDVAVEHATMLAAGFIILQVRDKKLEASSVLLHDTRESKYGPQLKVLISDPLEDTLSGDGERRKPGIREKIRLTSNPAPDDYDVVGLLAKDCNFV